MERAFNADSEWKQKLGPENVQEQRWHIYSPYHTICFNGVRKQLVTDFVTKFDSTKGTLLSLGMANHILIAIH